MRPIQAADPLLGLGLAVLRIIDPPASGDIAGPMPRQSEGAFLGGESVYPIRQSVTTIGRDLRNNVTLLDPSVSRAHACLICLDGCWYIENVSTSNTVQVGSRHIAPGERASLESGDVLRLGHTSLQLLAPPVSPRANALWKESAAATGGIGQTDTSAFGLLDPGVTIRFALAGHLPARARWAVALGAGVLLGLGALITLGTALLVGRDAIAVHGAGQVLAALTIPLVPALGAAFLVGAIDRYEREPVYLLASAFAWGAVIAIPAALLAERPLTAAVGELARAGTGGDVIRSAMLGLSAGLTEESVKGAGLLALLLLLRDEFDNVTDGIVYGVLIGAGFAMVENFVYFAGSPRGDLSFLILGRVVLGWLGHSTFTALFGAGLGLARETRDRRIRLLAPLSGFGAAVLLHAFFDFVDFQADAAIHPPHVSETTVSVAIVAVLLNYLPLFAAQAWLVRVLLRALAREAAIVREYLASEVPAGVVTPDEYVVLQKSRLRARVEHRYLLRWGPRAYLLGRGLHQTETGLAFRKWHVAMGDRPKAVPRQPEEVYRARIAHLRRALIRVVAVPAPTATESPTGA